MGEDEKKIKVVFENENLVVVDKPAGVVTTKENQGTNPSPLGKLGELPLTGEPKLFLYLEDWVGEYFPNDLPRKGIVHRLDKGTSGLVVVAKNADSLDNLKKQFKNRTTKKTYLALVEGDFPFEAEVNMPIKRSNYGFDKFGVNEEGKTAITMMKIKNKYRKEGKIYSLVEVGLKTGRTHQIRVHLGYLKWPIVGDRLYGSKTELGRPFLQAWKLEIDEPVTGERLKLESSLAEELVVHLKNYEPME